MPVRQTKGSAQLVGFYKIINYPWYICTESILHQSLEDPKKEGTNNDRDSDTQRARVRMSKILGSLHSCRRESERGKGGGREHEIAREREQERERERTRDLIKNSLFLFTSSLCMLLKRALCSRPPGVRRDLPAGACDGILHMTVPCCIILVSSAALTLKNWWVCPWNRLT